jgi:hypothetical protein
MHTHARWRAAGLAAIAIAALPAAAFAANPEPAGAGTQGHGRRPAITGSFDGKSAVMTVEHGQLRLRKTTTLETQTIETELRAGRDVVVVRIAPGSVTVSRNGRTVAVDSAESFEELQQLIGASPAVFATKILLSELEADGTLGAPEMSLLSIAAFVAALGGDLDAPRRTADRFVARHRGIIRPVGYFDSCWNYYIVEITATWGELQECMAESYDDPWYWAPVARLACNALWVLRGESAWFEFLKCLSPLSNMPQ